MFGRESKASGLGRGNNGAGGRHVVDHEREDDLGPFPSNVDSNPSAGRAQERALRIVGLVAVISGLCNVAFIMLFATLFPLQKVYPYLVTFKAKDQQVVSIEPMSLGAPGMVYATEDNIRDYIVQRHSFVPIRDRMTEQWGANSRLAARTSMDLYQRFAQASKAETEQMLRSGYTRNIDIKSVQRLSGGPSGETWQVNFDTDDTLPTNNGTLSANPTFIASGANPTGTGNAVLSSVSPTQKQSWVATLRITYLPQRVTYDKRLLNPLGFTVTDYSVTRSGVTPATPAPAGM